jgi:hypothetical protein
MNRLALKIAEPAGGPQGYAEADVNGRAVILDPAGAIYMPDCGLLCVSDLHLEKGAAYARRGQLLPPWDTFSTLKILGSVIRNAGTGSHDDPRHGDGPRMDVDFGQS